MTAPVSFLNRSAASPARHHQLLQLHGSIGRRAVASKSSSLSDRKGRRCVAVAVGDGESLSDLQTRLQQAVEREDYQLAARLRDALQ